jgi:hypothetical protein
MIWLTFFTDIRWINAEPAQFGCGFRLGRNPPPWASTAFWWIFWSLHTFLACTKNPQLMLVSAAKPNRGRKK